MSSIKRLFFFLSLLALTPPVFPESVGYGLGKITVQHGGHAVRDLEDGVLLEQYATSDCKLVPASDDAPHLTLAGTRGTAFELALTVLGCRQATPPEVRCAWEITPQEHADPSCRETRGHTSGSTTWPGWEGQIEVVLPAETGVYDLTLDCKMGADDVHAETKLEGTLFVTYAAPLVAFSPPHQEWYARASCWAAGLDGQATEADALEAILQGLYRYGGENWRYGYAYKEDAGHYRFPLEDRDSGHTSVHYELGADAPELPCYGDPPYCTCRWQHLVDSRAVCKFADCYIFSDVLQSMAGVFGIGGLRYVSIHGETGRGFLTKACRSLDPKFRGNVDCTGEGTCDTPYYFGNHSLRSRDGTYYDATFNNRYATPDDPIARSRAFSQVAGEEVTFLGDDTTWQLKKEGYGSWSRLEPKETEITEAPGGHHKGAPPLRFTGNSILEAKDPNEDGLFNRLVAEVEVEILTPGEYTLEAVLLKGEEVIAYRPAWAASRGVGAVLTGAAGKYHPTMRFSGEEIHRAGQPGPYTLQISVHGAGEAIAFRVDTEAYDPDDFGETAGRIVAVTARSDDERPRVAVELEARQSGELSLELRLAHGAQTLGYAGAREDFFKGYHTVELPLPAGIDAGQVADGVEVTTILYDEHLKAISDVQVKLSGF